MKNALSVQHGEFSKEFGMIRFVHFFNYADGLKYSDGEAWYLGKHIKQVKKIPGIRRYLSWQRVDAGFDVTLSGALTPFDQFVRRSELWFDNIAIALKAVMDNQSLWTPSKKGIPGFKEFECMFIDEDPQYNLLQDAPPQHYKYMPLPLWWPKGRPAVDEDEEIFIDTYCFSYPPNISFDDGEDWYLGHHTREGKQLPGNRHYKTWKTIRVPEKPGFSLQPNKWVRMTELGLSPKAFIADMINEETKIKFTQSPVSGGFPLAGWLNISIKLDQVEDLLA